MKRSFFVQYTPAPGMETVGMVMQGSSGADVARQIRERYRQAKIDAIKAHGDGVSKAGRRRNSTWA